MSAHRAGHRVRYTGSVQGVGFRATAASIARGFAVTGWVRNQRDGSVEMVVEGEAGEIERFLQAIRDHWPGHVDAEQVESCEVTGAFERFEVRR